MVTWEKEKKDHIASKEKLEIFLTIKLTRYKKKIIKLKNSKIFTGKMGGGGDVIKYFWCCC